MYVGLVLQGQGIRHCIEAHRRYRPYCMGSLYWQLNDSWPVVSWSGIDYYGNWKALHYQARRAFTPLYLNIRSVQDSLTVYLFSDRLVSYKQATLQLQLVDFNGKIKKEKQIALDIPANGNLLAFNQSLQEWANAESKKSHFLIATLKDKAGNLLAENLH